MSTPEYVFVRDRFLNEYLSDAYRLSGVTGILTTNFTETGPDLRDLECRNTCKRWNPGEFTQVVTVNSKLTHTFTGKPNTRLNILYGETATITVAHSPLSIEMVSGPNGREFADYIIRDLNLNLSTCERRIFRP